MTPSPVSPSPPHVVKAHIEREGGGWGGREEGELGFPWVFSPKNDRIQEEMSLHHLGAMAQPNTVIDDYVLKQILNTCDVITRTKVHQVCHHWKQLSGEISWVSSKGERLHPKDLVQMKPRDILFECAYFGSLELVEWIAPKIIGWDWNEGLRGACQGGHQDIAQWMIEKGADNFSLGLRGACRGGHRSMAEWMIEKGAVCWDLGLRGACRGGHQAMAQWMIEMGADEWDYGLGDACRGGYQEMVEWMIKKGANKWDHGLRSACRGGHQEIAQLLIDNGATDLNWGLGGACRGGHWALAEWLIEKGANDWNLGLSGACRGGHRAMAEWMIEEGADDWDWGLRMAINGGHQTLTQLMIDNGGVIDFACSITMEEHVS
jgi:hypothetical protein